MKSVQTCECIPSRRNSHARFYFIRLKKLRMLYSSCTVALGTRVSLLYKKSLCHRSEGHESTVALVYPVVSATQDPGLLPRKRAILIFDNIVYCIDPLSGRRIWKNELPVEVGSRSSFQEVRPKTAPKRMDKAFKQSQLLNILNLL